MKEARFKNLKYKEELNFSPKILSTGTSIFSIMSALAKQHNAINLSQGFPDFDISDRLKQLVNKYIQKGQNQYAPMQGVYSLRNKIAQKIQQMYAVSIDPETEITVTLGATEALFSSISAFIRSDDEVIIIEPAYDSYRPAIEVNGGIPIAYSLSAPTYKINWPALKALVTAKTRMIIINSPHNPTAKVLEKEDLQQLEQLTSGTDILVLSDEVYEHLVFDGQSHQSVLCFPELRQRSLAVFSFGKTFHATGWRIGYCIAPKILMHSFRAVHQFNVFSIHTPTQYALAEFLDKPEEYLQLASFFQQKRNILLKAMSASRFRPIACEGTYFQLFDYSEISDEKDTDFAKKMTTEFGVAAIPLSVFYHNKKDEKIIRLCFAKKEETLLNAAALLQKM